MMLVGPPGSGKSQKLINLILDFPGAQLVTSTKLELWEATARQRELQGKTWLFNPAGLGDVPSTFGWQPAPSRRRPGPDHRHHLSGRRTSP
jgi:hypothetical protein